MRTRGAAILLDCSPGIVRGKGAVLGEQREVRAERAFFRAALFAAEKTWLAPHREASAGGRVWWSKPQGGWEIRLTKGGGQANSDSVRRGR
jgi:hypothetical protein